MNTITQLLGLNETATADEICTAVTTLKNSVLSPQSSKLRDILRVPPDATPDTICAAAETLANQVATLGNENAQLRTQDSELRTVQSAFTAERSARIELILANAIRDNKITLAQQDHWRTELEKDLAAAEAQLANERTTLNTESATRDLGNQKEIFANEQTRRAELVAFLSEKQAAGMDYDSAWNLAKTKRAALFAQMQSR